MTRRVVVPRAVPAAGCGGTGAELARFGDLAALDAVLIGPVAVAGVTGNPPPPVLRPVPGGLAHTPARPFAVHEVAGEHLPWLGARGVRAVVALRAGTGGELAELAAGLRRGLDFDAVAGVEVDLRGEPSRDPQVCRKLLARLRESLPRDLPIAAKLGPEGPDPVAAARAAVAGGAVTLVLAGGVPAHPEGAWLVGPAVLPVTERLVTGMAAAIAQGRVPDVPLVAGGGVTDPGSAVRLLDLGAAGVQVGTALLADPGVLWPIHTAVADARRDDDVPVTGRTGGAP